MTPRMFCLVLITISVILLLILSLIEMVDGDYRKTLIYAGVLSVIPYVYGLSITLTEYVYH